MIWLRRLEPPAGARNRKKHPVKLFSIIPDPVYSRKCTWSKYIICNFKYNKNDKDHKIRWRNEHWQKLSCYKWNIREYHVSWTYMIITKYCHLKIMVLGRLILLKHIQKSTYLKRTNGLFGQDNKVDLLYFENKLTILTWLN